MLKSKKKLSVVVTASMILMLAGVAGFAQRHFMLANAALRLMNHHDAIARLQPSGLNCVQNGLPLGGEGSRDSVVVGHD